MSRRALLGAAGAIALSLAGCGGPSTGSGDAPPGPGGWHVVELDGVKGASGVAVLRDLLVMVAGGNERRLFLLPLADVKPGVRPRPRPLHVEASREVLLEGTAYGGREEEFVARGYRLGALWDQPLDLQGVAARHIPAGSVGPAVDAIYLLERGFGVVYRGRLLRDAAGSPESAHVDAVFVVPDRERSGSARADWRDASAGLAGVLSVPHEKAKEDLYLVERAGPEAASFRVVRLDRFGQWQAKFTVKVPPGAPPDVGDLSWSDGRFVFVRGDGRGALVTCQDPGDWSTVTASAPTPAPDVPGAGPWRGIAHGPDGTTYLVSAGTPSRLAWRSR